MVKYSVIIPVYNAEKYLKRCLDSILSEPYDDVEIIVVNDGSKDNSGKICEAYAKDYGKIRYIAKENGGVSSARNAGLDIACGEYILFVDSDDYVAKGFFSLLDQSLLLNKCDLIQFSTGLDNGKELRKRINKSLSLYSRDKLMPYISDAICRKIINGPIAKLYRHDIIENNYIRFPEGASVAEDRAFNIKYSIYIQSYALSEQIVYYISTENKESLTRKRHEDLEKQFETVRYYLLNALKEPALSEKEKEEYQRALNFGECRAIYHDAKLLQQDHLGWLERQHRLRRLCKGINSKKMKYPKSRYCKLIMLPVQLSLTPVIDAIAWKLQH